VRHKIRKNSDFDLNFCQNIAKNDDLTSQLMCADIQVASGDYEAAFDRLLQVIKSMAGEDRDKAKNHLISLFNLVDPADPRLIKARAALASALF
jgi:putative thioredoxin